MSHVSLNPLTLRECEKLSEAWIMLAGCEQDQEARHVEIIREKVANGKALVSQVIKDGKGVGFSVTEIWGEEFTVLALAVTDHVLAFETLVPFWISQAKTSGCRHISFSTVRPGLIRQALKHSFKISRVEMRIYVHQ